MRGDALSNLLFIGLMLGAFWFLMIRPQKQRAQQQKAMIDALQPGAEVVTIGGIFGTVVSVDERVRIRVANGSELEVARQAIASVIDHDGEAEMDAASADADGDSTDGENLG